MLNFKMQKFFVFFKKKNIVVYNLHRIYMY